MISGFTFIIGAILIGIYYLFMKEQRKNYPPGPSRIPFIGSSLLIGHRAFGMFSELTKKYGKIFSIKLGKLDCIVLSDAKLIREAFNDPIFSGRPLLKLFNVLSKGKNGIISSDGAGWEEQRRYTLRHLRDFGFGKNSMESMIMEEVKEAISLLKKDEGKVIGITKRFNLAVLNSLWSIITGKRFSQDDPKLIHMLRSGNETFNEIANGGYALYFDWILELFPEKSGWNKMLKVVDSWLDLFETSVKDHKKNLDIDSDPVDFIDGYLQKIEKTKDVNSTFHKNTRGESELVAVIGDLFGAGSETTSQTLNWMILYLMTNPECQKKFQREIDWVVGKNKLPSLSDRPNMPYTEAIIAETLRLSTLTPTGLFHQAMTKTIFQGYDIPKDTIIIPYIKWVHFDETIWKNPHKFDPNRHLGKEGNFIKSENVIAFSVGKRACLGESLARDEIFLFATCVFQRFNISVDPQNPNPTYDPKPGMFSIPQDYKCILNDRIED